MFADDETGIGQLTSPTGVVSEFTLKPVDEWAREFNGHQHSKPADKDDAGSKQSPEESVKQDSDKETKPDKETTPDEKNAQESKTKPDNDSSSVSFPVNYPLGAYGVTGIPELPKSVLIKNVTIWALDKTGKIENGAILFGDGKVQSIIDLKAKQPLPDADLVIDGEGGHVTPGIIDCHSHMATDSGAQRVRASEYGRGSNWRHDRSGRHHHLPTTRWRSHDSEYFAWFS